MHSNEHLALTRLRIRMLLDNDPLIPNRHGTQGSDPIDAEENHPAENKKLAREAREQPGWSGAGERRWRATLE
jgi:hypothetical protein